MPSARKLKIPLSNQDVNDVQLKVVFEDGGRCELTYHRGTKTFEESFESAGEINLLLGKVGELNGLIDEWTVRLFNVSNDLMKMTLRLEWYEKGRPTPLAVWIPDEAKDDQVKVPANDKVWLSSYGKFI